MSIDQRRIGIGAMLVSGVYSITLFLPESTLFKIVYGTVISALVLVVVALIPMPRWRESEARLRAATRFAVTVAIVMAVSATAVRLVVG